jgi:hypothetical protein
VEALATALKENLSSSESSVCYTCKKPAHFAKERHKGTKANEPPTGSFGQELKPPRICPHYKCGHHWTNKCHSQTDVEGKSSQGQQGNSSWCWPWPHQAVT